MKTFRQIFLTRILLGGLIMVIGLSGQSMRTEDLHSVSEFVLVVDRSGSMGGTAMSDAKEALKSFVNDMRPGDKAAVIEFSSGVILSQRMTSDRSSLLSAIGRIRAEGATQLYDAVGRALLEVRNSRSIPVIVFLTDGRDNMSSLSAADLGNMGPSQGVFVYGIGLGDVDQGALKAIASATGGSYDHSAASSGLQDLYKKVLKEYYENIGRKLSSHSQLVVRSLPMGQPVFFNGSRVGQTPLLLSNIQPGNFNLRVDFPRGKWENSFQIPAGKKGYIDARESEVPMSVAVLSTPHNGMTFIDGQFVGYTSPFLLKKTTTQKGWLFKRDVTKEDFSRELIIPSLPKGHHTLKIVSIPEDGFEDFFKPLEYEFYMGESNLIIVADCRTGEVETREYSGELKAGGKRPVDPFDELDSELEDF